MIATVREMFHRLEESGVRYALLRNYEQLCDHLPSQAGQTTDVDLVIASEDIPQWRHIAISIAEEFRWDALTECAHFTQSSERAHHIEIFRFYRHDDGSFLQVDLFHAYLIWGLPLMTEGEMLEDRVRDAGRSLTRIDPFKENTFRLLQIQGLLGSNHAESKIARYRDRVLQFDHDHAGQFRSFLNVRLGGWAAEILDALQREDWNRYLKMVRRAKASFWLRSLLRRPWGTALRVSARLFESRKRHYTNPCGRMLNVYTESPLARTRLRTVLNELQQSNCIDRWSERDSSSVREQGGLIVQWAASESAEIAITERDDSRQIRRRIVDLLVRRHQPLFIQAESLVRV